MVEVLLLCRGLCHIAQTKRGRLMDLHFSLSGSFPALFALLRVLPFFLQLAIGKLHSAVKRADQIAFCFGHDFCECQCQLVRIREPNDSVRAAQMIDPPPQFFRERIHRQVDHGTLVSADDGALGLFVESLHIDVIAIVVVKSALPSQTAAE